MAEIYHQQCNGVNFVGKLIPWPNFECSPGEGSVPNTAANHVGSGVTNATQINNPFGTGIGRGTPNIKYNLDPSDYQLNEPATAYRYPLRADIRLSRRPWERLPAYGPVNPRLIRMIPIQESEPYALCRCSNLWYSKKQAITIPS